MMGKWRRRGRGLRLVYGARYGGVVVQAQGIGEGVCARVFAGDTGDGYLQNEKADSHKPRRMNKHGRKPGMAGSDLH